MREANVLRRLEKGKLKSLHFKQAQADGDQFFHEEFHKVHQLDELLVSHLTKQGYDRNMNATGRRRLVPEPAAQSEQTPGAPTVTFAAAMTTVRRAAGGHISKSKHHLGRHGHYRDYHSRARVPFRRQRMGERKK